MKLSPRHIQVLELMREGLLMGEVAVALSISPFTVKTYVVEVRRRLGVRTILQAVIIAIRRGYISLDGSPIEKTEVEVGRVDEVFPFCYVCRHTVYDLEAHQLNGDHRRNARRVIVALQEQLE